MKVGDIVKTKDLKNTGRVSYVYASDFVDVVWHCKDDNWHKFASSKELKNQLINLGQSVKYNDKPVIIQMCKHGKVFVVTAFTPSSVSLDEILSDLNPHDRLSIVPLSEMPIISGCTDCGF